MNILNYFNLKINFKEIEMKFFSLTLIAYMIVACLAILASGRGFRGGHHGSGRHGGFRGGHHGSGRHGGGFRSH